MLVRKPSRARPSGRARAGGEGRRCRGGGYRSKYGFLVFLVKIHCGGVLIFLFRCSGWAWRGLSPHGRPWRGGGTWGRAGARSARGRGFPGGTKGMCPEGAGPSAQACARGRLSAGAGREGGSGACRGLRGSEPGSRFLNSVSVSYFVSGSGDGVRRGGPGIWSRDLVPGCRMSESVMDGTSGALLS